MERNTNLLVEVIADCNFTSPSSPAGLPAFYEQTQWKKALLSCRIKIHSFMTLLRCPKPKYFIKKKLFRETRVWL